MQPSAPSSRGFEDGHTGVGREIDLEAVIDGQLEIERDRIGVQAADAVAQIKIPSRPNAVRLLRGIHAVGHFDGRRQLQLEGNTGLQDVDRVAKTGLT
ncbi:hypothetical protein D3C76_1247720 [compost metagenome]